MTPSRPPLACRHWNEQGARGEAFRWRFASRLSVAFYVGSIWLKQKEPHLAALGLLYCLLQEGFALWCARWPASYLAWRPLVMTLGTALHPIINLSISKRSSG